MRAASIILPLCYAWAPPLVLVLKITFLQVGNEEGGANFLRELDFDLAHQGARADIVGARDFRQLLYTGLPACCPGRIRERPTVLAIVFPNLSSTRQLH